MSHASAWRCSLPGNESDYRLGNVFFNVVRRFIFCAAADFTDHANCFGATVSLEKFQHINKPCADDRIATDSYTGGLTDTQRRQLTHRFVGQGSTTGNDPDSTLLMDMSGHDTYFSFTRRNNTGAIRSD